MVTVTAVVSTSAIKCLERFVSQNNLLCDNCNVKLCLLADTITINNYTVSIQTHALEKLITSEEVNLTHRAVTNYWLHKIHYTTSSTNILLKLHLTEIFCQLLTWLVFSTWWLHVVTATTNDHCKRISWQQAQNSTAFSVTKMPSMQWWPPYK